MDQDLAKNVINSLIPVCLSLYGGKANYNIPVIDSLFANYYVKALFIFTIVYINTQGDVQLSVACALIIHIISIYLINNNTQQVVAK